MNAMTYSLIAASLAALSTALATNVGLSTIEQPINLGAEADKSRIPLGPAPTEANYHYGRGPVITAPRAMIHGFMRSKEGVELNQNLASVFGIELDNHDLPHSPATIRLYQQAKPAYSPYSREQVLAATIHCLLRSNSGSPKAPIELKVVADDPADEALARKFSGDYINAPDNAVDPPVTISQVPGTVLETDMNGVTWVVFPEFPRSEKEPPTPIFVPFRFSGEGAPDNPTWQLLPVWVGNDLSREAALRALGRPYPLFYDCFEPGSGARPEAHAVFATEPSGSIADFQVNSDTELKVRISVPQTDAETLAALVLSIVVSSAPTAEAPLTVILDPRGSEPMQWHEAFAKSPGWELIEDPDNRHIHLQAKFAWDPAQAKLILGSVPAAEVVRATQGPLFIEIPLMPEKNPADKPEDEMPTKPE